MSPVGTLERPVLRIPEAPPRPDRPVVVPPPEEPDALAWREGQLVVAAPSTGRATRRPVKDPARRPRPRRRRRGASRFRVLLTWTFIGLFAGAGAAITVPTMIGYHTLTVLSGSMEPTLHVGDVVVVHAISPLDARVGDIVTFRDPGDDKILITHRVRALHVADGVVHVTTKGDANNTVERWSVPASGSIGLVQYRIGRVGFALVWASGRFGRLGLIVFPALVLGAIEVVRIWRPTGRPGAVSG